MVHLLLKGGLNGLSPQHDETSFDDWWAKVEFRMADMANKGLHSIRIIEAWMIWNHCNRCVFDRCLLLAFEEMWYQSLAGTQGLSFLLSLEQAGNR